MLVILTGIPISAPGKPMGYKELIAQIIFVNFIRKVHGTVSIYFTSFGRNIGFTASVYVKDYIRVVKRIDINRTP